MAVAAALSMQKTAKWRKQYLRLSAINAQSPRRRPVAAIGLYNLADILDLIHWSGIDGCNMTIFSMYLTQSAFFRATRMEYNIAATRQTTITQRRVHGRYT